MTAAAGWSAPAARDGRSCASACPILPPRPVAVTRIWADSRASVERLGAIYARQAPSRARDPERLPELAGSGAVCYPPPRRAHRGAGRGAAAAAIGFLVPLFLPPGGCSGAVRRDP